jgi:hypothetical protein
VLAHELLIDYFLSGSIPLCFLNLGMEYRHGTPNIPKKRLRLGSLSIVHQ